MTDWSRFFGTEVRTQEPKVVRAFAPGDALAEGSPARPEGDEWVVQAEGEKGILARLFHRGQSVPLFEAGAPGVDDCLLVYRARVRADDLKGRAYLEMWCSLGGSDFFSKGLGFEQVLTGPGEWTVLETPFLLRKGERPGRVRLNLAVEGAGTLRVKDVELLAAALEQPEEASP